MLGRYWIGFGRSGRSRRWFVGFRRGSGFVVVGFLRGSVVFGCWSLATRRWFGVVGSRRGVWRACAILFVGTGGWGS